MNALRRLASRIPASLARPIGVLLPILLFKVVASSADTAYAAGYWSVGVLLQSVAWLMVGGFALLILGGLVWVVAGIGIRVMWWLGLRPRWLVSIIRWQGWRDDGT